MANLVELFDNIVQMQNLNGVPLANGKMYVYALGRTRLMDTWSDVDGESLNSNPIILDAAGQCHCYVTDDFDYTIVVCDAYDNEIFSIDKYLYSQGSHSHADVAVAPSETIAVSSYHVGETTVYVPYLTGQLGKVYEGIDPIVVNNTEDKISANHVPLGVQDPLYFVQDDEEGCIIGFSGQTVPEGVMTESALGFENNKITGYNGSAFSAGNEYEAGSYVDITDNTISVTGLTPVPSDTASTGLVAQVSADIVSQIPSTAGLASEQWVSQNYQSAIDFGYNSANAISSINDSAIAETELNVTTELGSFTVNPNTAGVPVEVIYPTDVGKLGIPSAIFQGEWENWSGNSGASPVNTGSYISLMVNTNTPATAGFTFNEGDIIEVNLPMTVSGVSYMTMYYLQSGYNSPITGPIAVKNNIAATNTQFTPGKYIFTAVNNAGAQGGYGQVLALVFARGAYIYGPSDISNIEIARNARDISNGVEVNLNRYNLSANPSYFTVSASTTGNLIEPTYSFRNSAERGAAAASDRILLNSQNYSNGLSRLTGNQRSIGEVVNASSGDRIPYTLKSITGDGNYNTTSATFSRIYNDVNSGIIYEERDFIYSSNGYTKWDPSASYAVRYSGIGSATPQIPVTGINGIKISESGDQVVFEVSGDYYTNDNPSGFITGVDLSDYATTAQLAEKQDSLSYGYHDSAISSIDESALYDTSAHARINTLAGRISDLSSNKLDTTAFSDVSGKYLPMTTSGLSASGTYLIDAITNNRILGINTSGISANPNGGVTSVQVGGYNSPEIKIQGYYGTMELNSAGAQYLSSDNSVVWKVGDADHLYVTDKNPDYQNIAIDISQAPINVDTTRVMIGKNGLSACNIGSSAGMNTAYAPATVVGNSQVRVDFQNMHSVLTVGDIYVQHNGNEASSTWNLTGSVQKREIEGDTATSAITAIAGSALSITYTTGTI